MQQLCQLLRLLLQPGQQPHKQQRQLLLNKQRLQQLLTAICGS
jgi:hypothetical protein